MIDTVIQWMSNALETVKLISILDIIDICIVAYVVYRILLFIRRSRSGQVAKAILIIIIALGVASTLRLRGLPCRQQPSRRMQQPASGQ